MTTQRDRQLSRRRFLGGLTLAGAAGLLEWNPTRAAAEEPPEVMRLRLTAQTSAICVAPKYLAEEFLQTEGFTDIRYTVEDSLSGRMKLLASGETDLDVTYVGPSITRIDAGDPIVMIAGVHIGCFELFGSDRVRAIRDLKGKTVAVSGIGNPDHAFLASILVYIGLDPQTDITLVIHPPAEAMQLLAGGKIDALLSFPPVPQELRAKKIGRVLVNSALDRPWSQYFCCMAVANREFVRKHPVAAKRAVRAILKGADICALEPQRAARFLVDRDYVKRYDYALQSIQELPYAKWREYDPEDAVRFYALRLREAGMIKGTPQRIIAQGTDWRFLNELRKELKG